MKTVSKTTKALIGAGLIFLLVFAVTSPAMAQTVVATIAVGTSPVGVGVNPNTNRIYVANNGSNTVSVINGVTNAIVATIPITSPGGVGVNPTTNRIYVSEASGCSGQSIFVIDGTPGSPTENTVIATIPVSGRCLSGERGIAVNPVSNRIYIPSFDPGGQVIVIDGASNTVIAQIGVAANPLVAAVNPVTNKIYVGHGTFFSRTRITIIDGATNAVSDGPVVGLGAAGIGVNPATNRIYVHKGKAAGGDPPQAEPFAVVVIDGANNAVLATIPVGTGEGGVGVNPTTNRIYVANISSNNVSVIDITPGSPTENTVVATIGVGSLPFGVAVNPATSRIYVTNIGSNTISVIGDPLPNTPPVALCKNVTVNTSSGVCTTPASVNNNSSDPDGDPITLVQSPAGPYNKGTTSVTLTVTDDEGASDSCTATVTVVDSQPPSITCPASQTVECTGSGSAAASFSASASDNCGFASTSCSPASGSTFPLGTTLVSCSATDGSSNSSACSTSVTVVDTTKPTVSCVQSVNPSGKNVPQASNTNQDGFYKVGASDTCSTPTIKIGSFVLANGETIKITQTPGKSSVSLVNTMGPAGIRHFQVGPGDAVVTATDGSGNSSSVTCLVPPPPK